ncbi:MAG: Panacea domain-containing protein [Patescibacteria group bacterium]
MPLQKKKYYQVILYFCRKLGGEIRGKKKLAKLLYFADFDFFEKNGKPITGDTYKALPMGPFPISLDEIVADMKKKNLLDIRTVEEREGYVPTEVYSSRVEPNPTSLTTDEKKILDRVIKNYGGLNGKQLEDLTHNEAPYVGTELKKEIPYELSFYRGTDFGDL